MRRSFENPDISLRLCAYFNFWDNIGVGYYAYFIVGPNNGRRTVWCVSGLRGLQVCGRRRNAQVSTGVELFCGQPDSGSILEDGGLEAIPVLSGE